MTRPWKRNSYDNILVLTVLLLVKSSWTFVRHKEDSPGKMEESSVKMLKSNEVREGETLEVVIGTSADANSLQYYLNHWNESGAESSKPSPDEEAIYYGEGLPDVIFHSSVENNSFILADMSRCLSDFGLVTCMKFLLLSKLDDALSYLSDNNLTRTDFFFMNGAVSFKRVHSEVVGLNFYEARALNGDTVVGLDEDITQKVMKLFEGRSLQVNLLPCLRVEVTPVPGNDTQDFIGFTARTHMNWKFWRNDAESEQSEGRGRNKRKKGKGGLQMPSMMMLPQLIMWGLMPFALANLQAMVMNAFMLNMMALNSAIFMTIRNLVFGPRGGPKIKYVNYGYRKKKKSSVPTVIVHSPAAFVKQPFHKFRRHKRPTPNFHHGPPADTSPHYHHHQHYQIHSNHPSGHAYYSEESPTSYSEVYQSAEPTAHFHNDYELSAGDSFEGHHAIDYEDAEHPGHQRRENSVQVIQEDGQLDGKNRVRIRIRSGGATSMKELLHRVRSIEKKTKRKHLSPPNESSAQEGTHGVQDTSAAGNSGHSRRQPIPETIPLAPFTNGPHTGSDLSTSHDFNNNIYLSQFNGNNESQDYVINYDKNQFTPVVTHAKQIVGR